VVEGRNLNSQRCSSSKPSSDAEQRGKEGGEHGVGTIAMPFGKIDDFNLIEILGRDSRQNTVHIESMGSPALTTRKQGLRC